MCKSLFQLLEVNLSTQYDGRLHEKDFKEEVVRRKLEKVLTAVRLNCVIEAMKKMFVNFGRPFEALGDPEKYDENQEIWKEEKPLTLTLTDFVAGLIAYSSY